MKFSLATPIEETKDLIAMHNMTEQKLNGAVELGGLPVPSLAITKADNGLENYGDSTLLFSKDTINPSNKQNQVFASDVYSKRFPKTINKIANEKGLNKAFERGEKAIGDYIYQFINHGTLNYRVISKRKIK